MIKSEDGIKRRGDFFWSVVDFSFEKDTIGHIFTGQYYGLHMLLIFLLFCFVFLFFFSLFCVFCSRLFVSLDCPFLIAHSVFSNVQDQNIQADNSKTTETIKPK